jgi:hypothetical protein
MILTMAFIMGVFGTYYYAKEIKVKLNPPEISFEAEYSPVISVQSTEDDILQYVTARDVEDGDISNEVIVEKMSNLYDRNKREITYVVCDSDNNVTKVKKEITYDDYEPPVIESIEEKPIIHTRKYAAVLACFKASDVIDGDISHRLKVVSIDTSRGTDNRGVFPVVLSVTNSCGDVVYFETSVTYLGEKGGNE